MSKEWGFKCAQCGEIIYVDTDKYVGEYVICPGCHTQHTIDYRIYMAGTLWHMVFYGLLAACLVVPFFVPFVRHALGLSEGLWGSLELALIFFVDTSIIGLMFVKTVLMGYIWPALRGRGIYFSQNPQFEKETTEALEHARKANDDWIGVDRTYEQMSLGSSRVQFAACGGDAVCFWGPLLTLLVIAAVYLITSTQTPDPLAAIRVFWIFGLIGFGADFGVSLTAGWVVLNRGLMKHVSGKL